MPIVIILTFIGRNSGGIREYSRSAEFHRFFSQVNMIKMEMRNRLSAESVTGIMFTKMVEVTEPYYEWVPSLKMLYSVHLNLRMIKKRTPNRIISSLQ